MKILKGPVEGYSIPLDAPLYPSGPWEYKRCEVLMALVGFDARSVTPLLPLGMEPSDPPLGAFFVAHYPSSDLGEYSEAIVLVQTTFNGKLVNYVPYIYVTSDVALAAGREVLGAPKKLAHIALSKGDGLITGFLERPKGKRLLTISLDPKERAKAGQLDLYREIPLVGLRVIPRVGETPPLAQLVDWSVETAYKPESLDAWTGEISVKFDSPSDLDPIHKLKIKEILLGIYAKNLEMKLKSKGVLKTFE